MISGKHIKFICGHIPQYRIGKTMRVKLLESNDCQKGSRTWNSITECRAKNSTKITQHGNMSNDNDRS